MTSPVLALRAGLRAMLVLDATLTTLLGGERIFDQAPGTATAPYVTFAEASARDWTAGEGRGHEHALALTIWSRQGGDAEALAIAARMAEVLDLTAPRLDGHRVVLLRVTAQEIARPTREGWRRATIRLAAFTEVVSG